MDLANSIIALQPGFYILRHPKTGLPPISISRAAGKPESNGMIEALYSPGTDGCVLRNGADCIVMHVLNAPVELLVTAYLEKAGATVPTLRVDRIALDAADGTARPPAGKPIEIPPKGISMIGHIERKGDVLATDGNRLGDPATNLRIEGFQVMWPDKPEGVDLAYSARIEDAGETPSVSTGKFCGTRNAARRLVGVTFQLTGPQAAAYALSGEAFFSGGFSGAIKSGAKISGPSGLEHLTALSVTVQSAEDAASKMPGNNPWRTSSRTKVFKKAGASSRKKS